MPVAMLTIRPTPGNRLHNLWLNFVRDRLPPTTLPLLCWSSPPFGYLVKEVAR
jgi:hypothetical protein